MMTSTKYHKLVEHEEEKCYRTSSLLSAVTFWWMSRVFSVGNTRPLEEHDLLDIQQEDEVKHFTEDLEQAWSEEHMTRKSAGKEPRLWLCVLSIIPTRRLLLFGCLMIINSACSVALPTLLSFFIFALSYQPSYSPQTIWACALGLPLLAVLKGVIIHQSNFQSDRLGMQLRSAVRGMVYHKILRTRKDIIQRFESGHVIDLVSNDVQRLETLPTFVVRLIVAPSIVITTAVMIGLVAGFSALGGFILCILLIPYMVMTFYLAAKYRQRTARASDRRIGLVTECVSGIRSLKSHALEPNYETKIDTIRSEEMRNVLYKNLVMGGINVIFSTFTVTFAFLCVLVFILTGELLTTTTAFLILSIGSVLRYEYCFLAQYGIFFIAETAKSLQRIQEFIELPNVQRNDANNIGKGSLEKSVGNVVLSNVSCSAGDNGLSFQIKDISLHIPPGSLSVVTGQVGAGKTSLLLTIVREMPLTTGEICCTGKVAYVPQIPWIFSGTIRDNILFHLPMDKIWYRKVIQSCQLEQDLQSFPDGDATIVGEKGAVLSGGQQARVSLARAVYANADILLLDDPLSAVDVKVGRGIFNECINGLLSKKTRILVTHSIEFMKEADNIVVLDSGAITANIRWNVDELHDIDEKLTSYRKVLSLNESSADGGFEETAKVVDAPSIGLVAYDEEKMVGHVSSKMYWAYFRAGFHWLPIFLAALLFVVAQVALSGTDVWVSLLSKMDRENQHRPTNLYIYVGLVAGTIICCIITVALFFLMAYKSSVSLHHRMVTSILHAPILFFDTTPIGRIINRFSKDIGCVDELLPFPFVLVLQLGLGQLSAVIVPSVTNYWVIFGSVPLLLLFCWLTRYYLRASRELKRLESVLRSPVFSHISETINGLETIRTHHKETIFAHRLYQLQDKHTEAFVMTIAGQRWLSVRIESICAALIALVGITAVLLHQNPMLTGLALTYAMRTGLASQQLIRRFGLVENYMTSIERVIGYTELEQEPGYTINNIPPVDWPTTGRIMFNDVTLRYYDGGPSILKNISCDFGDQAKVGVAGRTGAGKSSFVAALMRMPEAEGRITIDGIDIATINIRESRKCISLLSQTPVLFQGSLRENLDPFSEFSSTELWMVLRKVQLDSLVERLEGKLGYELMEEGANLSLGERQLLCLARTLLRKNKILVLDEPTAHVDPHTEQTIQDVLRDELKDCTVITIAHRLNTLSDCEMVMVMEDGRIAEYGPAASLLRAESD